LKDNIWTVIVGIVGILGAGIFWSYHRGKIRSLKIQDEIEEAHKKVAVFDFERKLLDERKEENKKMIEIVEEKKKKIITNIVRIENDIGSMSDEEIEQSFRDMF
jgi:hypothetical protein